MTKKLILTIAAFTTVSCPFLSAGTSLKDDIKKNGDKPIQIAPKEVLKKHSKESKVVAKDQDELSADVQDLIQDQTNKKVISVVGARPNVMKVAPIDRAFKIDAPEIEHIIVHTGQHYDRAMSDVFFEEMQIPKPNYQFAINGMGHGAMTGQMLEKIEEVLLVENPDWVLVYGDTNSTIAGALAASKLHIKVDLLKYVFD